MGRPTSSQKLILRMTGLFFLFLFFDLFQNQRFSFFSNFQMQSLYRLNSVFGNLVKRLNKALDLKGGRGAEFPCDSIFQAEQKETEVVR